MIVIRNHLFGVRQCRRISLSAARSWQNYENERTYERGEEISKRVKHALTYEYRRFARRIKQARDDAFQRQHPIAFAKREVQDYEILPVHTEVLIIGGGLSGSAVAYFIKERFRDEHFTVTVLEDPDKFANSKSILSTGEITQQFSNPALVDMALFSAEFMRHAGEHLRIGDNIQPDVNMHPVGFMHLARTAEETEKMRTSWKMQISKGVRVAMYTREEAEIKFPFINFDGVTSVTHGLENEGFYDPWQLLTALREKNITLGVNYVKARVDGFHFQKLFTRDVEHGVDLDHERRLREKIHKVQVRPKMTGSTAREIDAYRFVNCAGPWAGEIAKMAGIGTGKGIFGVPMPVAPRKRTYFVVHAPDVPAVHMPAFIDPRGVFCRPYEQGFTFICGYRPSRAEDAKADHTNMEVDNNEFYNKVWPVLTHRIPLFKNAKIVNSWAAPEDVNLFDDGPIMGEHLFHDNLFTISGFANYGAQMSLAAGKLYAERLMDDAYTTVPAARMFDFRRILQGTREHEPLKL